MTQKIVIKRDTSAWKSAIFMAFGLAVIMCALGIWNLPSEHLARAFVTLGYFFSLSSVFTLAKTIRDNQYEQVDTPAWRTQTWLSFLAAVIFTAWGLFRMELEPWAKSYMVCAWFFLIFSAFTLAKMIRDGFEADLIERAQVQDSTPTG